MRDPPTVRRQPRADARSRSNPVVEGRGEVGQRSSTLSESELLPLVKGVGELAVVVAVFGGGLLAAPGG